MNGTLTPWRMSSSLTTCWNGGLTRKSLTLICGRAMLPEDPGAQIDKAEELRVKWGVESGMMFGLGKGYYCPECGKWHDM